MFDCLIIGGGIIGLSLAHKLTLRGQHVAVVDRRTTPTIASWAAAGILPPPIRRALHDPLEQLRDLSHQLYRPWCERLHQETEIDVGLIECGGLYLGRSRGERLSLEAQLAQWKDDGVDVEPWDLAKLAFEEPALGSLPKDTRVFFLPDELQVRPSRLLKALEQSLAIHDVPIHRVTSCLWSTTNDDRVSLQTPDGQLTARHACVTTGPWAPELLQSIGLNLPIEPRRGQIACWQMSPNILKHIINEGPRYLVGRPDGIVLVGSTVEEVGFDGETTAAGIEQLKLFASSLLPELADREPRATWAGLRPWSADGMPYLGFVPGMTSISIATGHFRSGIHLAPATAQLMSELICGDELSMDLAVFSPGR